jgi:hypothetical protein
MPHEVIIEGTTFIVNSFSREGVTENLEELLERVIVKNAVQEFKKNPCISSENPPEVI